ncbi:phage head closure protein [Pseudomonas wadenswilerensis]|uniref:Phage head-tail adaptor n=1 Tax=Pseudomonas wadenswilerensis TaxID=1785161 RepID=A0A380SZN3_9PSED|nr:phage head closure protein [Pseudomonas wadenswilerensis]SUQ62696.1 Phage head-tail adaptor [Pseudomonas wadenswilerensis]
MRAGPLKHRCVVTKPHRQKNASGGAEETWLDAGKVWAEITMPTGRVAPVAEQLQAVISAEVRIRPRADIVAGWRLACDGVTYKVEAPLLDNDRTMQRLLCSTIPNP